MKIVALSGGVGGARLVAGLAAVINPKDLTIVVNTGDDFSYWGQHISPDIDIVMYHLAEMERELPGWGIEGDSFNVLEALKNSQAEQWFQLGDKDLATSIIRSTLLHHGYTLTEATQVLASLFGIQSNIFPMTDQFVPTVIRAQDGTEYPFQDYMVKLKCEPEVKSIEQKNLCHATMPLGLDYRIAEAGLIIIGPSNPFVSIATMLNIAGMKESVVASPARKVAVSPIIGGKAIKGPAAKMMRELGLEVNAVAVAEFYKNLIDCFVLDIVDEELEGSISDMGLDTVVCDTLMKGKSGRRRLAEYLLCKCSD